MLRIKRMFLATLFLLMCTVSYAAVPHLINYQGRLTNAAGTPLTGYYKLTFRIYDAENAGTLLWQGTYNNISIAKGIFSVLLGDVSDSGYDFANLAFDKPYWLEVKVGEDEPMKPRQRITSAGYALRSEKADIAVRAETADKALTIEARTSDPASPVAGQIWLRTDL